MTKAGPKSKGHFLCIKLKQILASGNLSRWKASSSSTPLPVRRAKALYYRQRGGDDEALTVEWDVHS